ncbi:putative carboxylesterase 16 [Quercus suber]|uniref:Carboxylesterase 16 n=1 Tax=Quercus suber TaxID=58331 RepID=A0AAW0LWM5_QUESU
MPPTLTVVAEHGWMRDQAIAYSEELWKVNVDTPVLHYKDAVYEFATFDMLLKTPQAQGSAEDIAIWVKKFISPRVLSLLLWVGTITEGSKLKATLNYYVHPVTKPITIAL